MPILLRPASTGSIWGFLLASFLLHALTLMLWPVSPPAGSPGGGVLQVRLAPGAAVGDSHSDAQPLHSQALAQADNTLEQTVDADPPRAQAKPRDAVSQAPAVEIRIDSTVTKGSARRAVHKLTESGRPTQAVIGKRPEESVVQATADTDTVDPVEETALPERQAAARKPAVGERSDSGRPKTAVRRLTTRAAATTASASAAAAPVAGERGGTAGDASQLIQAALREALLPHFDYPLLARRRGWEGRVRIGLLVQPDGDLTDMQVLESSGYRVLDQAALRDLREVGRLPQATAWLDGKQMDVILPIRYRFR